MKRPILMKGERLIDIVTKKGMGGEKPLPRQYTQAKQRIIQSLNEVKEEIKEGKANFLENEIILSVKMEQGFLAKSYRPDFLTKDENMTLVGARKGYFQNGNESDEIIEKKIYFYRTSIDGIDYLNSLLEVDDFSEGNRKKLCMIDKIEFLKKQDKVYGFIESDVQLDVEIVIHPLKVDYMEALEKIKGIVGQNCDVRYYEDGPTFILANIDVGKLDSLSNFNFLRTVHPMREIVLPNYTRDTSLNAPVKIVNSRENPIVKVGVFDGGVTNENDILNRFVTSHELSSLPPQLDGIKHGTNVCSAVLFGELNGFKSSDTLPTPKVCVESFRVLPEKNLYAIIDNIENVVNTRDDIKVYNISFGPEGPILDDHIDRFTYALDILAHKRNVLFCIAVGNDGDLPEGFNRIQSPSDSVNNLAVGAYSIGLSGKRYRAGYSCVGLGREGAKLKPDLLEFGGDESFPFHALGMVNGARDYTCGTSFAAPVVAGKIGEMINISDEITPFIGRNLLIHSAEENTLSFKDEGHGLACKDVGDLLNCTHKKITIIYTGEILETKYIKLPIPLPNSIKTQSGTVKVTWTISTLVDVNGNDTDGYTSCCIEDTLYTDNRKYSFSKKGFKSITVNIEENPELVSELIDAQGYRKSAFPKSASPKYRTEEERREDLQWDTVVRKYVSKRPSSFCDPFLILHCIPRDIKGANKVRFCVSLTIEHDKYCGDMYEDILTEYPALVPLETRIENEIRVSL